MKKIITICILFLCFLWAAMLLSSCTIPYRIVETITTDSTGKQIRTINKYYDYQTVAAPQANLNVVTFPFLYPHYNLYYNPYRYPRIVVPTTPRYIPRYTPRYIPRNRRQ